MEISIKTDHYRRCYKAFRSPNCFTFRVSPDANKYQIKSLVEQIYGVKVEKVNTAVVRGKNKSRWTKSGLLAWQNCCMEESLCNRGRRPDYRLL